MTDSVETNFTQSDGLSIAYQDWGEGERNLVLVPGMITHLEASLSRPGYVNWIKAIASLGRLAVFDKRGNGMSDRMQGAPSLDERVMDIEAVMDATAMASATLIGLSEGASLACVYAAMRPDRVERLVLCGGYARGRLARGFLSEEALQRDLVQFREGWGSAKARHPFSAFGPGPEDPAGRDEFAQFQRMSATPTTVAALYELASRIDISAILPSITQPTLVLHRSDEVPNGRDAAEDFVRWIPHAEYRTAAGDQHLPWAGDLDSYCAPIIEFVTGAPPAPSEATRMLATVLFSDLVGSTSEQARRGDEAWRGLMNCHDEICAAQVARHGGKLIKFTGDGFLATFNSPTSALDCAGDLIEALSALGLKVRFGAHTGEIEIRGEDISGLGVVVASRIMDQANEGQILASDLVRQLMLGSIRRFEDRGFQELKGVPDAWRLHEVSFG